MATSLAVWGGPGPSPFHAPAPAIPVIPSVPQQAISDSAFRRNRKRKWQLEEIGRPEAPVSVVSVPDAIPEPEKYDFRTLAELSGTSIEAFRAKVDREIAALLHKLQEDDDEEAFTMILTMLED